LAEVGWRSRSQGYGAPGRSQLPVRVGAPFGRSRRTRPKRPKVQFPLLRRFGRRREDRRGAESSIGRLRSRPPSSVGARGGVRQLIFVRSRRS
jgi:hypothetical protein